MVRLKKLIPLLIVIPLFSSCYYDNQEVLHPSGTTCDTAGIAISYATDIVPILSASCSINNSSCHNSSTSFRLDTYTGVHDQAVAISSSCSGLLVLAIKHQCVAPVDFMPQGGTMLDNCNIMKIEAWVNRGTPNN
jgi:hypothetical protein